MKGNYSFAGNHYAKLSGRGRIRITTLASFHCSKFRNGGQGAFSLSYLMKEAELKILRVSDIGGYGFTTGEEETVATAYSDTVSWTELSVNLCASSDSGLPDWKISIDVSVTGANGYFKMDDIGPCSLHEAFDGTACISALRKEKLTLTDVQLNAILCCPSL
jgi:hypothetical protein